MTQTAPKAITNSDVTAVLGTEEIREKFNVAYHAKHVDTISQPVFGE